MKERLRLLRKQLGLNQTDFASKLGLKLAAYSSYETGAVPIRENVIKTICYVYKINENWLRNGEGEMFCDNYEVDALMDLFSQLNPRNQKYARTLMETMLEEQDSPTDEGG